jgi:hypothetical protein
LERLHTAHSAFPAYVPETWQSRKGFVLQTAVIRHPIDELLPTAAGCCPLLAKSRPAQRSDGAEMSRDEQVEGPSGSEQLDEAP